MQDDKGQEWQEVQCPTLKALMVIEVKAFMDSDELGNQKWDVYFRLIRERFNYDGPLLPPMSEHYIARP